MLSQCTWANYMIGVILISAIYYLLIVTTYYRTEIVNRIKGRRGRMAEGNDANTELSTAYDDETPLIGRAQADALSEDLWHFGPPDPDLWETEIQRTAGEEAVAVVATNQLVALFSEMIAEVRTLIRVVAESTEPRENFEMLFILIAQKFCALRNTDYQQQVNKFLLTESKNQFPFQLSESDLDRYWTED